MIQKIDIENFQSHKKSVLEFNKGMNVIIGSSDSGKSAIIRALKLLIENKPSGKEFISNWADECEIILTLPEGNISRKRNKGQNTYYFNDILFSAIGTTVPEEIQKALNITEINLQQQHDTPFLLTQSPGNVAAHFNKIARLDQIDIGLSNVNRQISKFKSDIAYKEQEIEKKRKQLDEFIDLEKFEKELEKVEEMEKELKQISRNTLTLKTLNNKIFNLQQRIEKIQNDVSIEADIDKLLDMHLSASEIQKSGNDLEKLYNSITRNKKQQEDTLKSLSEKQKEFEKNFPNICPLCDTKLK